MTMVLGDRRKAPRYSGYPVHEIEQLRDNVAALRTVMTRMDRVLDRMEEQQEEAEGGDDA